MPSVYPSEQSPLEKSEEEYPEPVRKLRATLSNAKFRLFTTDLNACALRFASAIAKSAPAAISATTVNTATDIIISIKVKPQFLFCLFISYYLFFRSEE